MRFSFLIFLATNVLLLGAPLNSIACGYSFVGSCSTGLQLKINNTVDSFQVASCPFGTRFDGLDLGEIQTLRLIKGRSITWESCQNNVTAVSLYYRVYQQGNPGGNWSFLSLAEDYNTMEGPYLARYRSALANINLASGLSVGTHYVMEVYFQAAVDTIGDDFIPETTLLDNNAGQNYHLSFTYGGPSAPPFSVVKTLQSNITCAGDSTGIIGVTVYGDQSGLFYQWSNVNNNFFALFNLPAGAYTVTVSGSSGYTQSQSFSLENPAPLILQKSAEICNGGTYIYNGHVFTIPGNYTFTIPGLNSCDTTINLNLQLLDAEGLINNLPETANVTCAAPSLNLCANSAPNATFNWYKNGVAFFDGPCLLVNFSGTYTIVTILSGNAQTCSAAKTISVESHTTPALLSASGTAKLNCTPQDTFIVVFHAITDAQSPLYEWTLNGQLISTSDSCMVTLVLNLPLLTLPNVEVTDIWGCVATATPTLLIQQPIPFSVITSSMPASGPGIPDGSAMVVSYFGGIPPYTVAWSIGASTDSITGLLPGVYCVTISDANACSTISCVNVGFSVSTLERFGQKIALMPNILAAGESFTLILPDDTGYGPLTLQWIDAEGKMVFAEDIFPDKGQPLYLKAPGALHVGMFFLRVFKRDFQGIGTLYVH